jgi:type II secretory ATPase GspE/PulE/Tfp pilus assembly ATPase PilB-like protein
MVTLREDGFKKVAAGLTTVDEILRVTESTI